MAVASDSDSEGWDCPAHFSESDEDPCPKLPVRCLPLTPAYFVFVCHTICLAPNNWECLATKVWRGSLILSRALMAQSELVDKMRVLELGCGVGLCGILASLLGSKHVVLTDCSWDGLKALLSNVNGARSAPMQGSECWGTTEDSMQIRWHLWQTDEPRSPGRGPPQHWSNDPRCFFGAEGQPPRLESCVFFDVVIGADVLYFHQQVGPLAITISTRLGEGGVALLTLTVRRRDVYLAFIDTCRQCGLEVASDTAPNVDALDKHHLAHGEDGSAAHVLETASAQEIRLVRLVRAK